MNKFHYFAALATSVLMLAGCSTDEVLSSAEKTQAIGFDAMANKPSRSEVTTANIERFRVFGCATNNNDPTTGHVIVFNNTTVAKDITNPDQTNTVWDYLGTQYWAPNKDYYFIALSTNVGNPQWSFTLPTTHDTELKADDSFKGYGTVVLNMNDNNRADNDLVYAYATRVIDADISNSSVVYFSFNHMLSRIGLTFTNTITTSGYSLSISNVYINGIANKGTVTLGSEPKDLQWTKEGSINVPVGIPNNNNLTQLSPSTKSTEYKYIIPGNQELTISFDVEVKLNNVTYSTRTMSGTIAAKDYLPGHSYMLTAKIDQSNVAPGGAKPIEFTVTAVAGWGDDENGDINFPEPSNP